MRPDPSIPLPVNYGESILSRFSRHASAHSTRVAIEASGQRITYKELQHWSNATAEWLRSAGIRRGDTVAIHATREAGLCAAILGTWKAQAAFVILDAASPAKSLATRAHIAGCRVLLAVHDGHLPVELHSANMPSVRMSSLFGASSVYAEAAITTPDDLAYIAFTSGSTGTPKAIAGTHGPLQHFLDWYERQFALEPGDRFSMLGGLGHDPLLRDIFGALYCGGTVCIPDTDALKDPEPLLRFFVQEKISRAHMTPSLARILIAGHDLSGIVLPSLQSVCFGGEALPWRIAERMARIARSARLVNFYGTTETPQAMSWFEIEPNVASPGNPVPLGRGIDGVQLLIVDTNGRILPEGRKGEIWIRTPHLATGYLNADSSRFCANPFASAAAAVDPSDRVYKTGDLGMYTADGSVHFLGRADYQVKIRGVRVEPGETESVLRTHPSVVDACAGCTRSTSGDIRLGAYIMAQSGSAVTNAQLRAFLEERLPSASVPSAFAVVDRIPLTANGKVDWRPLFEQSTQEGEIAPTEEVRVWTAFRAIAPGVDSPDASFFETGGDSLLAVELLVALEKEFGRILTIGDLIEHPTPRRMAAHLNTSLPVASKLVVTLAEGDGDQPVFFIHPIGGNVAGYRALAEELDALVYGIQAMGLDGSAPSSSIPEMAERYVEEIRRIQPDGPYVIGGHSAGGLIACEAARLLTAKGDTVRVLLLDTRLPTSETRADKVARKLTLNVRSLLQGRNRNLPRFITTKLRNTRMNLMVAIAAWRDGKPCIFCRDRNRRVEVLFRLAERAFRPVPVTGEVLLMVASEEPQERKSAVVREWTKLQRGNIQINFVAGDHETMLDRHHALRLARKLKHFLKPAAEQVVLWR